MKGAFFRCFFKCSLMHKGIRGEKSWAPPVQLGGSLGGPQGVVHFRARFTISSFMYLKEGVKRLALLDPTLPPTPPGSVTV